MSVGEIKKYWKTSTIVNSPAYLLPQFHLSDIRIDIKDSVYKGRFSSQRASCIGQNCTIYRMRLSKRGYSLPAAKTQSPPHRNL